MEHNMRIACVASFNFASFQAVASSNMETRQHPQAQVPAHKWRSVVVSLHVLPSCYLDYNKFLFAPDDVPVCLQACVHAFMID